MTQSLAASSPLPPEESQPSPQELLTEIATLRERIALLEGQQQSTHEILERQWLEAALREITAATAAATGQEFLTILAQSLSLALQVRHAVITELVEDELQTLAFWSDGQAQSPAAFPLSQAPCCSLSMKVGGYQCVQGLQQQFQGYPLLIQLEGESYTGVPLRNSQGQAIGNICIIHDQPIAYPQQVEAILRLFAARASVELERQKAVNSLQQLNQDLQQTRNFLQTIINHLPVALFVKNAQEAEFGNFLLINKTCQQLFGMPEQEILGKSARDFHSDYADRVEQEDRRAFSQKVVLDLPDDFVHNLDLGTRFLHTRKVPLFDENHHPQCLLCISEDITEQKQAEEALKRSLLEKEVLLQEIHHRVKNNLQTVCSLLRLQANTIKDSQALEQLRESQNRVHAMGLIHEKLYQSENLAEVDFAEYVRSLVEDLFNSYNTDPHLVQVQFDLPPVQFGVDIANPCGLILNELVSNALKHAFPNDCPGTIQIRLRVENSQYYLEVKDDGIGLPPDLDIQQTRSLGLRLVKSLVQQLNGLLTVESKEGTRFEIQFAVG